jgi:hypothetical protein
MILNVQGADGVRQTEIQTAKPSASEVAVGKFKRRKLPGVDHIPAEKIAF